MKHALLFLLVMIANLMAGDLTEIQLKAISPEDLVRELHLREAPGEGYLYQLNNETIRLLMNRSTNKVLILGESEPALKLKEIISFMDVSPRQILIEVQIVEVNRSRVKELGLNWQQVLNSLRLDLRFSARVQGTATSDEDGIVDEHNTSQGYLDLNFSGLGSSVGNMVQMLVSNGAANISSAPRIVTTNNREGSILDGEHTTYVARYSTYGEVYETQELNTGLSLRVTPSIGDNDLINLDMEAKFTDLSNYYGGSPVERGQILNNHVIVRNNEAFLLGAFKQRMEDERKWHFPLLGRILPFIFSNTYAADSERDVLLVVTPKIIDQEGSAVPQD